MIAGSGLMDNSRVAISWRPGCPRRASSIAGREPQHRMSADRVRPRSSLSTLGSETPGRIAPTDKEATMDEQESRQHGGAQLDSIDGQGVDNDDTGSVLDTSTSGAGAGAGTGTSSGMSSGTGMGSGMDSGSGASTGMSGTSGMGSGMSSGMSSGSGMMSGSGGDVGGDGDLSGDGDTGSDLASGLGNATPGAGSNWTPGSTSGDSSNPILGGEDTESMSGSWGNRSGSGSGGQGEREMTEDGTLSGNVSEDITGSAGTNG